MKNLGIVPARSGSKRLPGKNIRPFAGLPLIAWTILAAKESGAFCDVLISTDCSEIARSAETYGALFLGLRPTTLATDQASSVDVAIEILDKYEQLNGPVDALTLLQPTSPLRSAKSIMGATSLFRRHNNTRPVVSFGPPIKDPNLYFTVQNDQLKPLRGWVKFESNSRDDQVWLLNGAIYIIAPERLRKERRFLTRDAIPYIMESSHESHDIDTIEDWLVAESALLSLLEKRDRSA